MLRILLVMLLAMLSSLAYAHGMSEEDQARILNAGYVEYIELGAIHMLTGYDHLLFLFGVIFFLSRFTEIVKFITAFTIGHSITLVFATLYTIKANYYLIDAVIALTVCYKGFDNLGGFRKYLDVKAPNLLAMVFIFGLIHGFGLSTRLQQLPLGDEGLVLRILSFNVGVELGQIAALLVMLFLLSSWRHTASFNKFSAASNVSLIMAGALLFLMQMHGYQHSHYTDEFPLNRDDHAHIHQDMESESSTSVRPDSIEAEQLNHESTHEKQSSEMKSTEPESAPVQEKKPQTHSHDGQHYHAH